MFLSDFERSTSANLNFVVPREVKESDAPTHFDLLLELECAARGQSMGVLASTLFCGTEIVARAEGKSLPILNECATPNRSLCVAQMPPFAVPAKPMDAQIQLPAYS